MTQASLSTVTLKTVANYRHAAEHAVGAYRSGGHRLIAAAQHGVDLAAKRGAEPYVPGLAAALRNAGHNVGGYAVKGVDAVSAGTERVIEVSANGVSAQVKRVAKLAGGVDNRVVARSLQAAARISLPGAQVALTLSERVAAGADKLAQVAAGPSKAKAKTKTKAGAKAKVAAKPVRRAAPQPVSRLVAKAARDTAAEIEVTGQAVKKAAKRRARAVVTQIGKAVKPAATSKSAKSAKTAKAPKAAKPKAAAKPVRRAAARKSAPVAAVETSAAAAA